MSNPDLFSRKLDGFGFRGGVIYSWAMRPHIWLRGLLFRWLEPRIQVAITGRILLYHARLIGDGFIPDLRPPYKSHSLEGGNALLDRHVPFVEGPDQPGNEGTDN